MFRDSILFTCAVALFFYTEISALQIRMTPPTNQQLLRLLKEATSLNNQDILHRRRSLSVSQGKVQDNDEYFIVVEIHDNQELDSPFIDLEAQNDEKKQSKDT